MQFNAYLISKHQVLIELYFPFYVAEILSKCSNPNILNITFWFTYPSCAVTFPWWGDCVPQWPG